MNYYKTIKKISILTVTYNSEVFLKNYFESILNNSFIDEVEILIYDCGSTDKTIDEIKKISDNHSNIKLLYGENLGFSKANNKLAKVASGDFLFFLNPDTKLDKNCLQNLIESCYNNKNSILIPKQLDFNGNFLSNGVGVDIFGYSLFTCDSKNKKIFYADGASIFIPKKIFFELGEFDSDYFMFYEDIDLSWRAHLYNISLVTVSEALVYHFSGGSITGGAIKNKKYTTNTFRRYLGEKNQLQNLLKNYSFPFLMIVLPINFLISLSEAILFLLLIKPNISWCYVRAYLWNICNLRKTLKKRSDIQKHRLVSDSIIIKKMYFGSAKLKILLKIGIPKFK